MPAAETGPVSRAEADRLLAPLARHAHVALAVSGGADSTALLFLAQRWRLAQGSGPRLSVLTVDHGLRPESRSEGEAVVALAGRFGLEGRLLTWAGAKPRTGLQNAAREARRALLLAGARELGADAIALAHTADDQAETMLMRLARGSGLDGLAGMAVASYLEDKPLIRPLLGLRRARLVATLQAAGLAWFEDPANANADFERIRMRRLLTQMAASGIDATGLARSAARLGRARTALEVLSAAEIPRLMVAHAEGFIEVARAGYEALPDELRLRLLGWAVRAAGGAGSPQPVRQSSLEALEAWLADGGGRARTLAGARIVARKQAIIIGREPGRLALEPVALATGELIWDRRFRVRPQPRSRLRKLAILPGKALGDRILDLAGEATRLPRFVSDSRPVVVADGNPVGFAGAAGVGVEAWFLAAVQDKTARWS